MHGVGHPQLRVKKGFLSKLQVYAQTRSQPSREVVNLPQAEAHIRMTVEGQSLLSFEDLKTILLTFQSPVSFSLLIY